MLIQSIQYKVKERFLFSRSYFSQVRIGNDERHQHAAIFVISDSSCPRRRRRRFFGRTAVANDDVVEHIRISHILSFAVRPENENYQRIDLAFSCFISQARLKTISGFFSFFQWTVESLQIIAFIATGSISLNIYLTDQESVFINKPPNR